MKNSKRYVSFMERVLIWASQPSKFLIGSFLESTSDARCATPLSSKRVVVNARECLRETPRLLWEVSLCAFARQHTCMYVYIYIYIYICLFIYLFINLCIIVSIMITSISIHIIIDHSISYHIPPRVPTSSKRPQNRAWGL